MDVRPSLMCMEQSGDQKWVFENETVVRPLVGLTLTFTTLVVALFMCASTLVLFGLLVAFAPFAYPHASREWQGCWSHERRLLWLDLLTFFVEPIRTGTFKPYETTMYIWYRYPGTPAWLAQRGSLDKLRTKPRTCFSQYCTFGIGVVFICHGQFNNPHTRKTNHRLPFLAQAS